MRWKEFLYFICDNNGATYAMDGDNLITTPSPKALMRTPDGWQDAMINYGRNVFMHGVMRNYTIPLGFVADGARIIKALHFNGGIEAVGNLAMAKMDHKTFQYNRYYFGALDFSQTEIDESIPKVEINALEAGLPMMLKANEETVYEIPVSGSDAIDVVMDGLILQGSGSYVIQEGPAGAGTPHMLGCIYVNSEGSFRDIVFSSSYSYLTGSVTPPVGADSEFYVLRNDGPAIVFTLNFDFRVTCENDTAFSLWHSLSDGEFYYETAQHFSTGISGGQSSHISGSFQVSLATGQRVFLSVVGGSPGAGPIIYLPGGKMSASWEYRMQPTTIKAMRPATLLSKLTERLTDGKYTSSSTLLNNEAADYVVTCGDAIRGLSGAMIKTSFKDFFQSFNTRFNTGTGVEGNGLTFEKKGHYYQSAEIPNIGEVSDLKITPAQDFLWNTVKIGWPNQDYDDINGRYEFNNSLLFSSPVKRVVKQLDLTAKYRTDPYGIEFTRLNLEGKTTTDNKSDNDVFIINIKQDGDQFILNRPAYSSLEGVPAGGSIFNTELSPKTCLIEHFSYLAIGMHKISGDLKFQTTEKNSNLTRTLNGVTITEKADVPISSLGPKMLLPHMFEFKCQAPFNLVDLMEENPFRKIPFMWKGQVYKGYVYECSQQPATNDVQTFKLIASIDNDLTKLI